ncbi:MAG: M20/M25/M40 family metallo-hydrolase [Acidobacteria bacterium]|nr:M20/M25/M40 family metallo-hydrolase [Acidobacteriota bacterium]
MTYQRPLAVALLSLGLWMGLQPECQGQEVSPEVRWLQGYLRIDTSNPPGDEFLGAGYLARLLHSQGIAASFLVTPEGRTSLYARLPATRGLERRPALLLVHHIDVVPAEGKWDFDPFSGELRDGFVLGRGAVDVKSLGIAQLAAFLALAKSPEPRDRDVVLLAVADEENGGGRGTRWVLEHHGDLVSDVGLVLNEGGANKVVNGRLLWWGIEVAQKRPLWLRVRARGRAGHASGHQPWSATHDLLRGLGSLLALPEEYRVSPPVREYLAALAPLQPPSMAKRFAQIDEVVGPDGLTKKLYPGMTGLFVDTVQVTVLRAGERINTISATASADIDVRLLPDTDADRFLERIRQALGKDLRVEVLVTSPEVAPSPIDTEPYRVLAASLKPEAPVIPTFISGFTDSRYFRERGIPAYGFSPFLFEPQVLVGIHNANEKIPVDAFDRGVARMKAAVRALVTPSETAR